MIKPTKIIKPLICVILIVLIVAGLGMMLSPLFDSFLATNEIKHEIQSFKELVQVTVPVSPSETISEPNESLSTTSPTPIFPELKEAIESYNQMLYETNQEGVTDPFAYETTLFDLKQFGLEQDVFAIVSIPSIDVEMPLYLGCTNDHLSKGLAQLSYTSIPIGGENTNCVIAGHRGFRNAAHLKEIEGVSMGDLVYVQNPWETLVYQVSEPPSVIEPHEINKLLIRDGKDMITIFTCHPYQTGSHRYVLFCTRVENEEKPIVPVPEKKPVQEFEQIWQWEESIIITADGEAHTSSQNKILIMQLLPWVCIFIVLLVAIILLLLMLHHKKKKKTRQ